MPISDRRPLTPRQQEVLAAIRVLTARTAYPSTLREIGGMSVSTASSVHHHVRVLERAGYVSRAEGRPRVRTLTRT